ncbi:MAG: dihydroneopterin aldolase [Chitinophagaceae bacterium]|nr:dihydroneopterin aldolase [Chitinophagaceae bacterium]
MRAVMTIQLNQLRFIAKHGLYAEELKTGNEFEVSLSVDHIPVEGIITDLSATVNYVKLYELVKGRMQQPSALLETVAMEITEAIFAAFPSVTKTELSITKLHPPIVAFTGNVGVKYCKEV